MAVPPFQAKTPQRPTKVISERKWGVDKSFVVPSGEWKVLSIFVDWESTDAPGNRLITLALQDPDGNEIARSTGNLCQAAGTRVGYTFAPALIGAAPGRLHDHEGLLDRLFGRACPLSDDESSVHAAIPDIPLPAGYGFRIWDAANADPTDSFQTRVMAIVGPA